MLLIFSLLFAITGGIMAVSYGSLAQMKGWPVGTAFLKAGFIQIIAGLSVLGALIFAIIQLNILWALGLLVSGWLVALILTMTVRKNAQILSILLLILSYVLQIFAK